MGVDAHCYIPLGTEPDDIFTALALIMGADARFETIHGGDDGSFEVVRSSWTYRLANMPGEMHGFLRPDDEEAEPMVCDTIFFSTPSYHVDGYYWYMSARSYAEPIAVFKKLVDFFGGHVDFNDCDDVGIDHASDGVVKRRKTGETPNDGKAYERYQKQFGDLQPPTYRELAEADSQANYKQEDMRRAA